MLCNRAIARAKKRRDRSFTSDYGTNRRRDLRPRLGQQLHLPARPLLGCPISATASRDPVVQSGVIAPVVIAPLELGVPPARGAER